MDDKLGRFDSAAGNMNIYVPKGYKAKAEYLAKELRLLDNRGNPSISALFRALIDEKLAAQPGAHPYTETK